MTIENEPPKIGGLTKDEWIEMGHLLMRATKNGAWDYQIAEKIMSSINEKISEFQNGTP